MLGFATLLRHIAANTQRCNLLQYSKLHITDGSTYVTQRSHSFIDAEVRATDARHILVGARAVRFAGDTFDCANRVPHAGARRLAFEVLVIPFTHTEHLCPEIGLLLIPTYNVRVYENWQLSQVSILHSTVVLYTKRTAPVRWRPVRRRTALEEPFVRNREKN